MTGSPTPAEILARIRRQYPGDIVYTEATNGSMLQALLDEEGPEALVEAVLDAAEVGRLRAIVTQLAQSDDEPCDLDHHGYCQSHLVGKPCLIALAREAIYTNPAETVEGE